MSHSRYFSGAAGVFFLVSLFAAGYSDLATDKTVLLALRSAVGGRTLLWNTSEPSPCKWVGVYCQSDQVVELHIPGMGLSGKLPENTLGNLTQLNTLSLRYNALSGSLPSDLSSLSNLRNLYLQSNLFSGEIPSFIFSMKNLVRLNLALNNFSGEISSDFNNLNRLGTLYLEENRLSGEIPNLDLPALVQFNVSDNLLSGEIPDKLRGKPRSAFVGNAALCGGPLESCDGSEGSGGKKSDKLSGGAIAGIVIGCVVALLVILLILFFVCCRKRGKEEEVKQDVRAVKESEAVEIRTEKPVESEGNLGQAVDLKDKGEAKISGGGAKKLVFFGVQEKGFDLEGLLRASAEVLGKGTFGTAYKAVLETGVVVAVKRLREVAVSEKEYREKIEGVGKMDHENLVRLRAYFYSVEENLLVYDYMRMGSLSALLHGNRGAGRTPLNWETRSAIALGAARGIAYIHSQGSTVSHGNIKSSNVLLTTSYEARVSDFGLAQLVGRNNSPNRLDGYRAPEVTDHRKVSQKADVYSFGVLLLELLTGKAPTHALLNEEGVDLPRWVQSVVREEWTAEVFDLELLRYQNVEEDMVQLLQLAIDCSAQYPDKRPSMNEVSQRIQELCVSGSQHDPQNDIIDTDSNAPPSSGAV
ncbi:putative inactive receptor kinase At1g48480 isoform X1 [Apium graveolens]|uniref:putative inactive receptor kinase At1g48480 isoform X1 n=1 Tax=Apium graveolens TaxID=4045 RepID=UPI003D7B4AD7